MESYLFHCISQLKREFRIIFENQSVALILNIISFFEIEKELNEDLMLMNKSRYIHCELVETLSVDGGNRTRFHNEPTTSNVNNY